MIPLTLGADPEFGLLSRGALVHAENALSGRRRGENDAFGIDGSGRPVELRPSPSSCPLGLVRTIRKDLIQGLKDYPHLKNYKWKAGSIACTDPIGGHIHFGSSALLGNDALQEDITEVLNKTLAPCGVLIENQKEARQRRLGSPYGNLKDPNQTSRPQPWGFEYRVLSSWLVSPRVAGGILSIAYAIVSEYINVKPFRTACDKLPNAVLSDISYPDKLSLVTMVPGIVKLVRTTAAYPLYKNYIETIFSMIAFQLDWNADRDMKKTWKLVPQEEQVIQEPANV